MVGTGIKPTSSVMVGEPIGIGGADKSMINSAGSFGPSKIANPTTPIAPIATSVTSPKVEPLQPHLSGISVSPPGSGISTYPGQNSSIIKPQPIVPPPASEFKPKETIFKSDFKRSPSPPNKSAYAEPPPE